MPAPRNRLPTARRASNVRNHPRQSVQRPWKGPGCRDPLDSIPSGCALLGERLVALPPHLAAPVRYRWRPLAHTDWGPLLRLSKRWLKGHGRFPPGLAAAFRKHSRREGDVTSGLLLTLWGKVLRTAGRSLPFIPRPRGRSPLLSVIVRDPPAPGGRHTAPDGGDHVIPASPSPSPDATARS